MILTLNFWRVFGVILKIDLYQIIIILILIIFCFSCNSSIYVKV